MIRSLAFSPDGRWLVSTATDSVARVWDVSNRRYVAEFRRHRGTCYDATFASDSHHLVVGSGDGQVSVYRCDACAPLGDLVTLANAHVSRALSPDERVRYGLPAAPRQSARSVADRSSTPGS